MLWDDVQAEWLCHVLQGGTPTLEQDRHEVPVRPGEDERHLRDVVADPLEHAREALHLSDLLELVENETHGVGALRGVAQELDRSADLLEEGVSGAADRQAVRDAAGLHPRGDARKGPH